MNNLGGVQATQMSTDAPVVKTEAAGLSMPKSNPRPFPAKKQVAKHVEVAQSGNEQGNNEKVNTNLVKEAVDNVNESLKINHTSVRFKYHENINRVSIKIVDDTTNEVIREIPPEETLEMVEKMLAQAGLIVDERG